MTRKRDYDRAPEVAAAEMIRRSEGRVDRALDGNGQLFAPAWGVLVRAEEIQHSRTGQGHADRAVAPASHQIAIGWRDSVAEVRPIERLAVEQARFESNAPRPGGRVALILQGHGELRQSDCDTSSSGLPW